MIADLVELKLCAFKNDKHIARVCMIKSGLSGDADRWQDFRYGVSGALTTAVAHIVMSVLPLYLEAVADRLGLSTDQIGLLGATDMGGIAVVTLLGAIYIKRLDLHKVALAGIVIAIIANLLSTLTTDFIALCIIRVVAGFGEGMMVIAGITSLGRTSNRDRWFSVYTFSSVSKSAIVLYFFPSIFNRWDVEGVFLTLAVLYALPLLTVRWLATSGSGGASRHGNAASSKGQFPVWVTVMALVSMLLYFNSLGGLWAYIAGIGTTNGFSLEFVSEALTYGMIGGASGSILLGMLGKRARGIFPLLLACSVMLTCHWIFNGTFNELTFIVTLIFYTAVWSIIAVRLYAVVATGDSSGRFIIASQPVVAAGFAMGPFAASMLVGPENYTPVIAMAATGVILCYIGVLPILRKEKMIGKLDEEQRIREKSNDGELVGES